MRWFDFVRATLYTLTALFSAGYLVLEFAVEKDDWKTKTSANEGYEWALFILVFLGLIMTATVVYRHFKRPELVCFLIF
jgi:hypothetical protein